MTLLQKPFRALVIGSSGTIGSALVSALQMHSNCAEVMGIHRGSIPSIDYADPSTIATAAEALAAHRPFDLIINATATGLGDTSPISKEQLKAIA
ncbi:MAG: NAD-dependent epimerase/dehydratase family protein, partial [Burkholderiaceae bacterium]|nr:NAD-dependent epimerase/dehydratase family protein [Burkholderiaceae bacterium]